MAPDRPIILVGVGRSGSTALHRALARHPHLAWLSVFNRFYPHRPGINERLMQALDAPLVGRLLQRRLNPAEAYGFWERAYPGFGRPFRDLTADDVTPGARRRIRDALAAVLTRQRPRLLLKVTGWPRVGFLHAVFPDARFVHVVRDGRAVAASLLRVDWWDGWLGPSGWRLGPLSASEQHIWDESGGSFVALAGLYWTRLQDAMVTAQAQLPPGVPFHPLRYEDLCADPDGALAALLAHGALDPADALTRYVRHHSFVNANDKWRTELSDAQQELLNQITATHRQRLGYDDGA